MLVYGLITFSMIVIANLFALNLETLRTESAEKDDQIGWHMAGIYALSQKFSKRIISALREFCRLEGRIQIVTFLSAIKLLHV